jgi:hypothetical protein
MSKVTRRYFMLILLLLCLTTSLAEAQMLRTKDGTILVGEIGVTEPFTIQTRYGVLKVPVSDIVQIVEEEVWLKNTSHFFGKVGPQTIIVKTEYGDLEISTAQVVWINFVKKEQPKKE